MQTPSPKKRWTAKARAHEMEWSTPSQCWIPKGVQWNYEKNLWIALKNNRREIGIKGFIKES